jgi:dihydrodipicolinate synthase/N-acetylneuraminate lyase
MAEERIRGTLAAAVTPLREGGEQLDADALGPLLEFYARGGPEGVLMLGTTGEGILLRHDERRWVAEMAIECAGALAVAVHCGAQTTAETCALAAHAAEAGADAVAVIGPPYFPFEPDELVQHFTAAAKACAPVPFYVYEYADRTGYVVPVSVVQRLRERAPNLTGMKVSDAPFARVEPYLATGLDIFIGAEECIQQGLAGGAAGAVSGVAAAFPEAVSSLVRAPSDTGTERVSALRVALSRHPFQASVKATLGFRGLPVSPDVRAPLHPLSLDQARQLRDDLEHLGALGQEVGPPRT